MIAVWNDCSCENGHLLNLQPLHLLKYLDILAAAILMSHSDNILIYCKSISSGFFLIVIMAFLEKNQNTCVVF